MERKNILLRNYIPTNIHAEQASKENQAGSMPKSFSFVEADQKNVLIEVLKMAEDGNGIIIRLYEAFNRRTKAMLRFGKQIQIAAECGMLENQEKHLKAEGTNCS